MIPKESITPQYLIEVLRRRLWYMVVPFFLVSMATIVYCINAPKVYKSSTLILVQPQEVPSDYVQPTVTSDARYRLNTLQEQVLSRPRLEEIIKKYDLYQEIRSMGTMYDAVESMRQHVRVEVKEPGRRDTGPGSFEVSYEGHDPAKVMAVTSAIANLFIEDNLRIREQQASGTSKFLERELERMRATLRSKEELVRQFKEQQMGLLPEQMENNYRILNQLQQQLDSINDTLQQTEDRRVILKGQLGRLETLHAGNAAATVPPGSSAPDQMPLSLDVLRQQLKSLSSRYSDQHPDIIRLKATIAELEKKQSTTAYEKTPGEQDVFSQTTDAQRLMVVQREDLLTQLKLIDKEIQNLNGEKRETSRQIEVYRHRIENGPRIEQMLVDLNRDYLEASKSYKDLLQKKMQADLAENLERTQKGEQFRILEPANLPHKPFKPDIMLTLLWGFGIALACGLGLTFLRENLDSTFRNSRELESVSTLPVLVAIPVITTEKERRWNMYKQAVTVCMLVSMASSLFYALFILWDAGRTLSL